jgi:predicted MFS family arabinose efflux permease
LSSLRVFAQNLGACLGQPVGGLIATYLAAYLLGWTSIAAIVPLACMFFAAWFLLKEPKLAKDSRLKGNFAAESLRVTFSFGRQIKNVLRWEILVPVLLVFFIQAVPTFRSTCFYQYQTGPLKYSDAAVGWLGSVGNGVALLSSGVYALCCRKIPLRISLYAAIILTYLSAIPYLFYTSSLPQAIAIEAVGTFLQYLAYLPIFDLIVRSTPKGSEALGYALLISVWNVGLMIGTKIGPTLYEHWLNKDMNSLIWLNAGITLAGIVLVFLLPKKFVNQSEGTPFAPAGPAATTA